MIEDEYKIKPVLARFNADNDEVLSAISEHLDKTLSVYLDNREEIRKAAFIEITCCLQKALLDTRNGGDLRERVQQIVQGI